MELLDNIMVQSYAVYDVDFDEYDERMNYELDRELEEYRDE